MTDRDTPARRPRVLTVGAYERDNFGDLLFLLVTERYLPDADVVAAAPFAADMRPLLDREVVGFGDVLQREHFDAVWTVGGEIGGSTPESAYRMSMPREVYASFTAAPYAEQRTILADAVDGAQVTAAYIPTPGAFPLNAGAFTVINSAGLAPMRRRAPHLREEMVDVLRTTDAVAVRDQASADWLASLGVEATLAPDVVHALGVIEPHPYDPDADNVVVQASVGILRKLGHEALARTLVTSEHLAGLRIRFLLAGLATGHDSVASVQRVVDEIARLDPTREVEVIADRRPLDLVDHIRRARVVISSSLHVRIVAASYGVPRLTFTRPKPTLYAGLWDPHMPVDVELPELDAAVGRAIEANRDPAVVAAAAELSVRADAVVRGFAEQLMAAVGPGADSEERAAVGERRRAAYERIAAERTECVAREERLRADLDAERRTVVALRAELDAERTRAQQAADARPIRRARRVAGRVKRRLSSR